MVNPGLFKRPGSRGKARNRGTCRQGRHEPGPFWLQGSGERAFRSRDCAVTAVPSKYALDLGKGRSGRLPTPRPGAEPSSCCPVAVNAEREVARPRSRELTQILSGVRIASEPARSAKPIEAPRTSALGGHAGHTGEVHGQGETVSASESDSVKAAVSGASRGGRRRHSSIVTSCSARESSNSSAGFGSLVS